jgi:diguanylate cyclase (GGDEF)-like protein/PAS domain S-box-containing protein
MKRLKHLSIKRKMTAVIMLTSSAALLLACAAFVAYDLLAFRRVMTQELQVLAQVVGNRSTASLAFDDPGSAGEALAALAARRSILMACIYDKAGRPFACYTRPDARGLEVPPAPVGEGPRIEGGRLHVAQRILLDGTEIGTLRIESDLSDLRARAVRYAGIVGLVLLISSLTAFLVSERLQRPVSGPILALAETASRVSAGRDYALRAEKQGEDEVGLLIDAFNEMLGQVQLRDEALLRAKEGAEAAAVEARRLAEATSVANLQLAREVAERRRAEEALRESEQRFRQLAENIDAVFWMLEADSGSLIYVSPAYERVWGRSLRSLHEQPMRFFETLHREDQGRVTEAAERLAEGVFDEEYRILRPDGSQRWVRTRAFPVRRIDGSVYRIAGITQDVTDRKKAEETIRHRAYHDELTGLPNRLLFAERFAQIVEHLRRSDETIALLFLDLDRFKTINDTLGHALGDRLLKAVAERLRLSLRGGDTVARFGGDEFIVLATGIEGGHDAAHLSEKILQLMRPPYRLGVHELRITTSVGIAVYPDDGTEIETLIKNADTALYRAKERGRNCFQLYSPAMNARALEQLALENDLRRALEQMEFTLHYQPEVDLRSGRIVGAEALVRWQRPGREPLLPQQFIPLAEDVGLIGALGEWVLRTACDQSRQWNAAGLPLRVAVNLSPREFEHKDVTRGIARALAQAGLDPAGLELELTESTVMRDAESAVRTLRDLKAMGVQIAIDDFGTGHSSLSYLKRFPVDALKIDQAFVRDLATDPEDAAIVKAVISLAHSLEIQVIAEGVETEQQLEFLRAAGCDVVQGFLLGPPAPPEAIADLVRNRTN